MRHVSDVGMIALIVMVAVLATACFHDGSDDDDDDVANNDGGGGGGGDDDDNSSSRCDLVFAFGNGIEEYADGAWTDSTPDLFSNSWRIADVAKLDCDRFLFAGRDRSTATGFVLADVNHAYVEEVLPDVSADWEITAIDARDGTVIAVGGDWAAGTGVILQRSAGEWEVVNAPAASSYWWLTDIVLTSKKQGYAVGVDMNSSSPIVLKMDDETWSIESAPGGDSDYALYSIDLIDKENGLAVGRNISCGKGAVVRLSGGTWYSASTPDGSDDWDLTSVAMLDETAGMAVGTDYDALTGVALIYADGNLQWTETPDLSEDWEFSGVAVHDQLYFAGGTDNEHDEGFVVRYESGVWSVELRSPYSFNGVRGF